ncbi:hypothetical protein K1719_034602 [Acacia pycnantha]|nr:hypothetical protein K1719_034602 [Acacia pycnantha]
MDDEKDRKVLQISRHRKFRLIQCGPTNSFEFSDDEDDRTLTDLAAPNWKHPAGPIWWCHVFEGHPNIEAWHSNVQKLLPAISLALRVESQLISDRMEHLLYEVCCLLVTDPICEY